MRTTVVYDEQLGRSVSKEPASQASAKKAKPRKALSAYDAALVKAKIERRLIEVVLAIDVPMPDGRDLQADVTHTAEVRHVDTYAVSFKIAGKTCWINKAFIVGAWIE